MQSNNFSEDAVYFPLIVNDNKWHRCLKCYRERRYKYGHFLSHLLTKFITNGAALSDFIPTFARSIKLSFANMAKLWTFFLTKKTQKGIALFRPWRRGKDSCITTFKSLLFESEESKCFGKFKLNPCTYCSLLLYF